MADKSKKVADISAELPDLSIYSYEDINIFHFKGNKELQYLLIRGNGELKGARELPKLFPKLRVLIIDEDMISEEEISYLESKGIEVN